MKKSRAGKGASQLRQELRREGQAEMSQVLGCLRQMDHRLQKVSSKVEELEEERNRGREIRQEMNRVGDPQMNRVGALRGAPCLMVSSGWSEAHRVAPEKDDVGVSRDCSVFLARPLHSAPHLLRSHCAQCIYLEPVLSLNMLLRGPVDRLSEK